MPAVSGSAATLTGVMLPGCQLHCIQRPQMRTAQAVHVTLHRAVRFERNVQTASSYVGVGVQEISNDILAEQSCKRLLIVRTLPLQQQPPVAACSSFICVPASSFICVPASRRT